MTGGMFFTDQKPPFDDVIETKKLFNKSASFVKET